MKTYGLEEAAAFLHVSKDSMRDMADSGKVPAAKIGPTAGYRRLEGRGAGFIGGASARRHSYA